MAANYFLIDDEELLRHLIHSVKESAYLFTRWDNQEEIEFTEKHSSEFWDCRQEILKRMKGDK